MIISSEMAKFTIYPPWLLNRGHHVTVVGEIYIINVQNKDDGIMKNYQKS